MSSVAQSDSTLGRMLEACYYDPSDFFRAFLRFDYLFSWQQAACDQIAEAIQGGARHIEVIGRTCHNGGKTALVAGLLQCFMYTRPQPKAVTLAQSWEGVEDLIWAEINAQWRRSLMHDLNWGRCLTTKLDLGPNEFAVGSSSDKPAKLEGKHGLSAMRIVDEAKEVDDEVFESTEGLLAAAETWDVWISTPSIPDGKFFRRDMGPDTSVIRFAVTVEDLIADYNRFGYPALVGMEAWRDRCRREWGESDPRYRSRVMAEYIDDVEGSLFPVSWIERAFANDFGDPKAGVAWRGEVIVGDDVAGSADGDLNAAVAVQHLPSDRLQFIAGKTWAERDTMVSKGKAQSFAREFSAPLRVDGIGIGKGVLDASRQDGYPTQEYRASDKARADDRYINRKAEDAFAFRKALEEGRVDLSRVSPEMRPLLKSQMVSMRYEELASGKAKVIDPTPSPDLFDALLIASARVLPSIVGLPRLEVRRGR